MSEVTYYFNSKGVACPWTDAAYMYDGLLTTFGHVATSGALCELDANTSLGTDLGSIIKVEVRVYGYGDGGDKIGLQPVFSAGNGTEVTHIMPVEASKDWSLYQDITTDTNAPSPWTWTAVQSMDIDVYHRAQAKANELYCAKVEIQVTYSGISPLSHGYIFG